MKPQTKLKKQEQLRDKIRSKSLKEPTRVLDKFFPKGDKRRGEALCLLAISFNEGFNAGEELIDLEEKGK